MPGSTNGTQVSPHEALEALRTVMEKLEADLQELLQQNQQLRAERDEFRSIVYDYLKQQVEPKQWDDFNEKDYTLSIEDLLAVVRGK
jgi:hypothetical protein